jgi:hypothetical protein
VQSPGTVTLRGHDRHHDWEVQRPTGKQGAVTVNKGRLPTEFTATFELFDASDFDAWEEFQQKLQVSLDAKTPKAKAIYHPDLARNRITDVVVKTISGLTRNDRGLQTASITFLEYRPQKAVSLKSAAASKGPGAPRPDPNAKLRAERDALIAQASKP